MYPTYGYYLWTSSEGSGTYARYLRTHYGNVGDYDKDGTSTYRRVRAFLTYGNMLWTSVDSYSSFARFLNFNDGKMSSVNKDGNVANCRVRNDLR